MKISKWRTAFLIFWSMIFGIGLCMCFNWAAQWHRYDEDKLLGLSKTQVEQRLGKPTSRVDDKLWIYQYGMDPEATLEFDGDKVTKVWSAIRNGFDK